MKSDKPYLEAFFLAMPNTDGFAVFPISQKVYHALENVTAEIAVPCNNEKADYCLVIMLPNKENDEPAILEMLSLSNQACVLVEQFLPFFKASEYGEES